jgi:dTDP-4-dehydrorhamnose 3,5-epimerase
MQSISEVLPGAHLLRPKVIKDLRGEFVKTFHPAAFADLGISFVPVEQFFSASRKHVLRGMHFQLPPYDHAKLIYCIAGCVLDVLLDLRKASPMFGRSVSVELSSANRRALFIPPGLAHGFVSQDHESLMVYMTSVVHAPSHDSGVRWDSFGFEWPIADPVLSARDAAFPCFADFSSPF